MHEMELTRCIRENEKLSKLLIRATGSKAGVGIDELDELKEDSSKKQPNDKLSDSHGVSPNTGRLLNDSTTLKSKLKQLQLEKEMKLAKSNGTKLNYAANSSYPSEENNVSEIEYPPPPPSLSSLPSTNSTMNGHNSTKTIVNIGSDLKLNRPGMNKWDQLNRSLLQEQQYVDTQLNKQKDYNSQHLLKNMHTTTIPPPESFAVEDAYAHSLIGKARNPTYVSENMTKVNSYMSKLQNYLTEYDIHEDSHEFSDHNPLMSDSPNTYKRNNMNEMGNDMDNDDDDDDDAVLQEDGEELDASLLEDSLDGIDADKGSRDAVSTKKAHFQSSDQREKYPSSSLKTYVTIVPSKDDKFNTTDQLLGNEQSQDNVTMNSEILKLLNDTSY